MDQINIENEAAVINEIDKINNLITQSRAADQPKVYPLDQAEIEVEISTTTLKLIHKLRKPTLAELVERDQQTPFETEEVSNGEDRLNIDDEGPNAKLWDKVALAVEGYRGNGINFGDWASITPELAALIPSGHKSAAIRGLYQTQFELEQEEGEGFALGATSYAVKQILSEYTMRHIFRTPTEAERRDFKRRANETRFARGTRKVRTKVLTNLKAYTELYDKLYQAIDGVSADGVTDYRPLIDPIWKRGAVDCVMRSFEASLSD
jgi:hypothetical protein